MRTDRCLWRFLRRLKPATALWLLVLFLHGRRHFLGRLLVLLGWDPVWRGLAL